MQEKWSQWKPLDNLADRYYIESISVSIDGFKILLVDAQKESKKVSVLFPHSVHAFRNTDETFRLLTIGYLDENYAPKFYGDWTFFKVENSEYLKWLSEQSHGISDSYKVIHFSIITDDEILDLAASYEPTVTFVD